MTCLTAMLLTCLFQPSNLYVTAGLEAELNHPSDERIARPCYHTGWCMKPRNSGAVGTLRIGMAAEITDSITLDYGLEHRSLVNTNRDRGQESAYVSVTWRPFR